MAWVKRELGFSPDAQQSGVLSMGIRRGMLNCTRQWGKSTIAAAKALHQACHEANSLTVVVSPSSRQRSTTSNRPIPPSAATALDL